MDKTDKNSGNEVALVCAARDGDKKALQQLLGDNWSWLKGLAYNILGNADDMDDALQNICVLVIDKIHTLREPERFKPWLATLARRAALSWRQKRSKKPQSLETLADAGIESPDRISADLTVLDRLAKDEQHNTVLKAINSLPEKYREVFILKYVQDNSYTEIAEIMEIPVTTIQIRLVRARRMIQNHLEGKPNNKIPRT
ncbi:MAG: RNA polymerase sigma factor [Phycisphaerae bacterium]|nr:RNA polymerase sigma factor [Phycisphaerae bacterium]